MSPKIHQTFWSDEGVEQLDAESKLVLLWLITCPQTNLLGVCQASPKRFQLDTSLPPEALQRAIQALGGSVLQVGQHIFIKNFIRHQFGTGGKLTSNNIFKSIKSHFDSIKEPVLRAAILEEYPELTPPDEGLTKGFKAQREGTRTGEGEGTRTELGGSGGGRNYALPENEKEAAEWCCAAGVPPDAAARYFHQCAGRGWVDGAGMPIRSWSSHAKHRYTQEQLAKVTGQQKNGTPRIGDIKAVIQAKEAKMAEIKNRYSHDAALGTEWKDDAKRREYLSIRKEVKELQDQLSKAL